MSEYIAMALGLKSCTYSDSCNINKFGMQKKDLMGQTQTIFYSHQ